MFCQGCGKKVNEGADICLNCGRYVSKTVVNNEVVTGDDTNTAGWGILGFFIPLVGLILYISWKDSKPRSAKAAGKGALISVIVNVVLTIIIFIIIALVAANSDFPSYPYDYLSILI